MHQRPYKREVNTEWALKRTISIQVPFAPHVLRN